MSQMNCPECDSFDLTIDDDFALWCPDCGFKISIMNIIDQYLVAKWKEKRGAAKLVEGKEKGV